MIINWKGEVLAKQGYGILTRHFLKPIVDQIKLIPNEDYIKPEDRIVDDFWIEKVIESSIEPDADITISFSIPQLYSPDDGKFNIGMSLWDTDHYPREWIPVMNKLDAVLVPSSRMKEAALHSGINNVYEFKPNLELDRYSIEGEKTEITGTQGKIKFIYEADFNKFSGFENLIAAYCVALEDVEDSCLIIKSGTNDPNPDKRKHICGALQSIRNKLIGIKHPHIHIITDLLTDEQTSSLLRGADYYIDTMLATTIDQAAVRAMACGLPMITHNHTDIDECLSVRSYTQPISEVNAPFYGSYQNWRVPDHLDLVEAIRSAYFLSKNEPEQYKEKKQVVSTQVKSKYSNTDILEVCQRAKQEIHDKSLQNIQERLVFKGK
jgi:hypothetical protein